MLPSNFENWRVSMIEMGKLVRACERDHLSLNGINDWIGGVHLYGKKGIWRLNAATMRVIRL